MHSLTFNETDMIFGYCRVSTYDQNLDLQIHDLKKFGCEKIFKEKISGLKTRPKLKKLLKMLRKGDVVVVWKLDRLGRSLQDLIKLVSHLKKLKVKFVSLKESIDTTTATGKLIFHIFAALAEFERDNLVERTKAGLMAARMKGHFAGRPPGLNKANQEKAKHLWRLHQDPKVKVEFSCNLYKVSRTSYYRYIEWASREEFKALIGKKIQFIRLLKDGAGQQEMAIVTEELISQYSYKTFREIKILK